MPEGTAFRFRCGPRRVPVITLGAGTNRIAFLGGRYATIAVGVPSGVTELGSAFVGRHAFVLPGRPPQLYVRTGRLVRRWLPVPNALGPSHAASAMVIGDSIILGAQSEIERGLARWNLAFDAQVSRTTIEGAAIARARGPRKDAVVVELGANEGSSSAFADRARELMAPLHGVPLVVWVTIRETRDPFPATNHEIRRLAATFPNLIVADWNAVAPPEGEYSDGLHLNPIGAAAMAHMVDRLLNPWLAATKGGGDLACRDAALAGLA